MNATDSIKQTLFSNQQTPFPKEIYDHHIKNLHLDGKTVQVPNSQLTTEEKILTAANFNKEVTKQSLKCEIRLVDETTKPISPDYNVVDNHQIAMVMRNNDPMDIKISTVITNCKNQILPETSTSWLLEPSSAAILFSFIAERISAPLTLYVMAAAFPLAPGSKLFQTSIKIKVMPEPSYSFNRIRLIYDKLLRFPLVDLENELMNSNFLTFRLSEHTVDNWSYFHKRDTLLHMLVTVKNTPETIKRRGGNLKLLTANLRAIIVLLEKKSKEVPTGQKNPFFDLLYAKNCNFLTFRELNEQMENNKTIQETDRPEKKEIVEYKNLSSDQIKETPLHVLARQIASRLRENPDYHCHPEMGQIFYLVLTANKYADEGGKEFLEAKDSDGKKFYDYIENPDFRQDISRWRSIKNSIEFSTVPEPDKYQSQIEMFFPIFVKLSPEKMVESLMEEAIPGIKNFKIFKTRTLLQTNDNILHIAVRNFAKGEISHEQLACLIDSLGRYTRFIHAKNNSGFPFYKIPELKEEQRKIILDLLKKNLDEFYQFPQKDRAQMEAAIKNPCFLEILKTRKLIVDGRGFYKGETIYHIAVHQFIEGKISLDNIKCLISLIGNDKKLIEAENKFKQVFYLIPGLDEEARQELISLINPELTQNTQPQMDWLTVPERESKTLPPKKRPSSNQTKRQRPSKKQKKPPTKTNPPPSNVIFV